MKKSSIGTMALAAAGSGVGGWVIGSQVDAKRTTKATSAMGSYGVLFPLLIGAVGYLALKGKHKQAAEGLAIGGALGAAFGFYKFGAPAATAAAPGGQAGSAGTGGAGALANNTGGQGGTGMTAGGGSGTGLGAMPRRRMRRMGSMAGVRRALRSPSGSGIGDFILPQRFQTGGGGAFGKDAWSRS